MCHRFFLVVRATLQLSICWLMLLSGVEAVPEVSANQIERYHIVWDSPSQDAHGSMPLGNGDVGLNAWVDGRGDLVFYVAKTDSWGDNGRLLKLGRVRVTLDPPLPTQPFRQTLVLREGTLEVAAGRGEDTTQLRLWVDAHRPLIYVTVVSGVPRSATAVIELWRTERTTLPSIEISDVLFDRSRPDSQHGPTVVEPDVVLDNLKDRIGWYHHNVKSVGPALHAETQGVTGYERPDPLLHRTFGVIVAADGGQRIDGTQLQSAAARSHRFQLGVLTEHPSTPESWMTATQQMMADADRVDFAVRRADHERWWSNFWERSWIDITQRNDGGEASEDTIGGSRQGTEDAAYVVSRAYALQRFVDACAGRGRYPIKFNGSIFTVPYADKPGDADYRRWGPGYWWQNTRLPYISMCASGDFEMLEPLLRMYIDEILPLALYRTRHYFGHGGAYYPECIHFWGDVFNETYGWTPFEIREDKLQESGWHKWEWVSGLELACLTFDLYDYTLDQELLERRLLPVSDAVLRFFDEHYSTDEQGRLVMHPSQALETWWDCTNPMPEVAGMHALTRRLLALPNSLAIDEQRAFWKALQAKLPELPTHKIDGESALAAADRFANKRNIENPELYAVYPFRLVSFEQDNVGLGITALRHRQDRGNFGWRQEDIFMAYLGLAEQAREYVVGRARTHHDGSRFPAFWGPNYDWIPDQDHGGVLMKALQAMVLQADPYSDKLFLLPAWPTDWNVVFKLHAPRQTTIEGEYRGGKLVRLEVQPAQRREDVVLVP